MLKLSNILIELTNIIYYIIFIFFILPLKPNKNYVFEPTEGQEKFDSSLLQVVFKV